MSNQINPDKILVESCFDIKKALISKNRKKFEHNSSGVDLDEHSKRNILDQIEIATKLITEGIPKLVANFEIPRDGCLTFRCHSPYLLWPCQIDLVQHKRTYAIPIIANKDGTFDCLLSHEIKCNETGGSFKIARVHKSNLSYDYYHMSKQTILKFIEM